MKRGEIMKVEINLDTMSSIQKFVEVTSKIEDEIILRDNAGHCVSAKSLLGAIYSLEWETIYCYCSKDISGAILPWII